MRCRRRPRRSLGGRPSSVTQAASARPPSTSHKTVSTHVSAVHDVYCGNALETPWKRAAPMSNGSTAITTSRERPASASAAVTASE